MVKKIRMKVDNCLAEIFPDSQILPGPLGTLIPKIRDYLFKTVKGK